MSIYCLGSWTIFVQKEYMGLGHLDLLQSDFMLQVDNFQVRNQNPSHQGISILKTRRPIFQYQQWSA